jgi:uncharacterized protein DUF6459
MGRTITEPTGEARMVNSVDTALQQLRPYEPGREDTGVLPETGQAPAVELPREFGPSGARPDAPPIELRQLRAVLNLILEVRAGHQPPGRLHALVHPRLFRLLSEETTVTSARYTLKSVHACRVAPDAIEACGTAHSQGRAYAVVARFERGPRGWRCVLFDLIRPRTSPRRP